MSSLPVITASENTCFVHTCNCVADPNVGRSIRALYENGWHVRKIAYFNKSLKEYKIDYADQTIDYISPHEIGGHDEYDVDVN